MPESNSEQLLAEQQKYYNDKSDLEKAITDSICNFVFIYGGRLNIEIEAVAEDHRYENGEEINRRVWTEKVRVTATKE